MTKGHIYTLVFVSVVKRWLRSEMSADIRLEFLQHLDKMTDQWLTPGVFALVEPIDDKGQELFDEAAKLGFEIVFEPGVGRRIDAFDVLYEKFDVFAALNPSLQTAHDAAFRKHDRQSEPHHDH